jgi:sarcosine oxidase subunit beta
VGGLRTLFAHRLEAELSLHSLDAYLRLERASGRSFGFRRCGYLLLATSPQRVLALTNATANAAALALPVEELSEAELARLAPGLRVADVRKAVFSPADGCILQPAAPAQVYAELAARSGASFVEHAPVTEIRRGPNGFALRFGDQTCHAAQLVIAANAFAGPLLEQLGVSLPSYPYPRHVFSLAPAPLELNWGMPIVVFQDEDLMLRHDGQIVTLICGLRQQSTLDSSLTPDQLSLVRERVTRRVDPGGAVLSSLWSGIRAMTPDRRALIGRVPGVPGAWCAIGFSGHGIMHAPAVGLAMAEWLRTGSSQRFNLSPLAPDRLGPAVSPPPVLEPGHQ